MVCRKRERRCCAPRCTLTTRRSHRPCTGWQCTPSQRAAVMQQKGRMGTQLGMQFMSGVGCAATASTSSQRRSAGGGKASQRRPQAARCAAPRGRGRRGGRGRGCGSLLQRIQLVDGRQPFAQAGPLLRAGRPRRERCGVAWRQGAGSVQWRAPAARHGSGSCPPGRHLGPVVGESRHRSGEVAIKLAAAGGAQRGQWGGASRLAASCSCAPPAAPSTPGQRRQLVQIRETRR